MSVPTSNVTVSLYVPDDEDVELIYIIPSTPFTCCSIGIPTVCAIVSALAPGYIAVTCTVGGVIEGYWSIGNTKSDTPPATRSNSDSTVAKIGRSMKNLENLMTVLFYCFSIIGITLIPLRTLRSALVTYMSVGSSPPVTSRIVSSTMFPTIILRYSTLFESFTT